MLESGDADFKSGLELSAVRLVIYNRVPKTGTQNNVSIAKKIFKIGFLPVAKPADLRKVGVVVAVGVVWD